MKTSCKEFVSDLKKYFTIKIINLIRQQQKLL